MPRKTKMNTITTPELIKKINPKNTRLLNDFIDYMKSTQKSDGTIAAYLSDIRIAFVWAIENNDNKFFVDWSKRNIVAYQNWLLNNNKNSPARIRRLKASLSSLSIFIENVLDDEFPNFRNIINKVESPPNRLVREKTVWADDELEGLLSKLSANGEYDKACFLALGMFSGRRKAELCRFKVSDFLDDKLVCDGTLYKSSPLKTKGRGGGKMLQCYTLAKKFKPYLDAWMSVRSGNERNSEWLFPSKQNPSDHISVSTVNSWADIFSRISGKDFYFHSIRHFFTTSLVRAGIPDSVITQIVGWESADMCKLYTDIDADEQIGMYFSDGEISLGKKNTNFNI